MWVMGNSSNDRNLSGRWVNFVQALSICIFLTFFHFLFLIFNSPSCAFSLDIARFHFFLSSAFKMGYGNITTVIR